MPTNLGTGAGESNVGQTPAQQTTPVGEKPSLQLLQAQAEQASQSSATDPNQKAALDFLEASMTGNASAVQDISEIMVGSKEVNVQHLEVQATECLQKEIGIRTRETAEKQRAEAHQVQSSVVATHEAKQIQILSEQLRTQTERKTTLDQIASLLAPLEEGSNSTEAEKSALIESLNDSIKRSILDLVLTNARMQAFKNGLSEEETRTIEVSLKENLEISEKSTTPNIVFARVLLGIKQDLTVLLDQSIATLDGNVKAEEARLKFESEASEAQGQKAIISEAQADSARRDETPLQNAVNAKLEAQKALKEAETTLAKQIQSANNNPFLNNPARIRFFREAVAEVIGPIPQDGTEDVYIEAILNSLIPKPQEASTIEEDKKVEDILAMIAGTPSRSGLLESLGKIGANLSLQEVKNKLITLGFATEDQFNQDGTLKAITIKEVEKSFRDILKEKLEEAIDTILDTVKARTAVAQAKRNLEDAYVALALEVEKATLGLEKKEEEEERLAESFRQAVELEKNIAKIDSEISRLESDLKNLTSVSEENQPIDRIQSVKEKIANLQEQKLQMRRSFEEEISSVQKDQAPTPASTETLLVQARRNDTLGNLVFFDNDDLVKIEIAIVNARTNKDLSGLKSGLIKGVVGLVPTTDQEKLGTYTIQQLESIWNSLRQTHHTYDELTEQFLTGNNGRTVIAKARSLDFDARVRLVKSMEDLINDFQSGTTLLSNQELKDDLCNRFSKLGIDIRNLSEFDIIQLFEIIPELANFDTSAKELVTGKLKREPSILTPKFLIALTEYEKAVIDAGDRSEMTPNVITKKNAVLNMLGIDLPDIPQDAKNSIMKALRRVIYEYGEEGVPTEPTAITIIKNSWIYFDEMQLRQTLTSFFSDTRQVQTGRFQGTLRKLGLGSAQQTYGQSRTRALNRAIEMFSANDQDQAQNYLETEGRTILKEILYEGTHLLDLNIIDNLSPVEVALMLSALSLLSGQLSETYSNLERSISRPRDQETNTPFSIEGYDLFTAQPAAPAAPAAPVVQPAAPAAQPAAPVVQPAAPVVQPAAQDVPPFLI